MGREVLYRRTCSPPSTRTRCSSRARAPGTAPRSSATTWSTCAPAPTARAPRVTPFLTGFLDAKEDKFSGRPAYILQMPDGALLVSDEQLGAIYRISYTGPGQEEVMAEVLRTGRWAAMPHRLFCACGVRPGRRDAAARGTRRKAAGLRRLPRPRRQLGHARDPVARFATQGVRRECARPHARGPARQPGHAGAHERHFRPGDLRPRRAFRRAARQAIPGRGRQGPAPGPGAHCPGNSAAAPATCPTCAAASRCRASPDSARRSSTPR